MASASAVDPQSLNLFAYVTNNPVDFVDPSGLDDETEEDSIIIITREPYWLKAVKSGGGASGVTAVANVARITVERKESVEVFRRIVHHVKIWRGVLKKLLRNG